MKILIKGGRVVDPKNDFDKVADVLVDNGVISEIGENINADGDVTVIDAEGKIVSPGLVDMHSHLRDPGQEYKEDILVGYRWYDTKKILNRVQEVPQWAVSHQSLVCRIQSL